MDSHRTSSRKITMFSMILYSRCSILSVNPQLFYKVARRPCRPETVFTTTSLPALSLFPHGLSPPLSSPFSINSLSHYLAASSSLAICLEFSYRSLPTASRPYPSICSFCLVPSTALLMPYFRIHTFPTFGCVLCMPSLFIYSNVLDQLYICRLPGSILDIEL